MLADSLNQHPSLVCHDEIFHYARHIREKHNPGIPIYEDGTDAEKYLRKKIFNVKNSGFKLIDDQARTTNLWSYLESNRKLVVIHLIRWNALNRYVSGKLAKKTGKWHTNRQGRPKTEETFVFTKTELEAFFRYDDALFHDVETRFRNHRMIRLQYEDLASEYLDTMNNLFCELGVKPFKPEIRMEKITTRKPSEIVENYAELKEAFADTLYGKYFE